MSIEILAPAGSRAQLEAAVRSGADAVYLGTKQFNARRNAENFGGSALLEAVRYCHGRDVKVYVTENTLMKDADLPLLYHEIEQLARSGVDGVIVQDLAVLSLLRRHLPAMPLHASTQMVVHNLQGALAAKELGFTRVILARELSLAEIKTIAQGVSIELEVFVHGALCMCMSGGCYLSSMFGERSGNRGLCAQPCRLEFASGQRPYALSLKDMCHIPHSTALREAGVCSLKIEGRMKRPEYVSAAVLACKEAVSGGQPDLGNLEAVFSRGGFTDGYLTGRRDLSMFGHRSKEDVAASAGVLGTLTAGYRRELSRVAVDMHLTIQADTPVTLRLCSGETQVTVFGDFPEKALTKGTDLALAAQCLEKTGGTPFVLDTLTGNFDPSLMVPKSALSALRKQGLTRLLEKRSEVLPRQITGAFVMPAPSVRPHTPALRVRLQDRSQWFAALSQVDNISLPLSEIDSDLLRRFGNKLTGELPRLCFPSQEQTLKQQLERLKALGLQRVSVGNLGTWRLTQGLGFTVQGNFDLNILNSESLLQYQSLGLVDVTLSFEINLQDAVALGGELPRGILGYGHLPLMVFRNCPAKGAKGCGQCLGRTSIIDRKKTAFPVLCHQHQYATLFNPLPLYLGDKEVGGVDFTTLYFTLEDNAVCEHIFKQYVQGAPLETAFTRGLYYRRLK